MWYFGCEQTIFQQYHQRQNLALYRDGVWKKTWGQVEAERSGLLLIPKSFAEVRKVYIQLKRFNKNISMWNIAYFLKMKQKNQESRHCWIHCWTFQLGLSWESWRHYVGNLLPDLLADDYKSPHQLLNPQIWKWLGF